MARGTTIYAQGNGTPAAYKAQYQPVSTILNQASTRTADTGQVNWATVSTESGTTRDYEIFALGGSLQATAPVFIRIDYMGGTSSAISVTVGTTTDGAGNLGGLTVAKLALLNYTQGPVPNQYAWAASDGESYFTFLYNLDPTLSGTEGIGMFVVERTRDAAGQPTGAGFHVWRWQATTITVTTYNGGWSKTFGAGVQPVSADMNFGVNIPDPVNTNTAFTGLTTRAFPAYTYTPPFIKGASKALLFGYPGEFPRGRPVPVDHYGEAMTFVPLGDAVTNSIPAMSAAATATTRALSPLIRWD